MNEYEMKCKKKNCLIILKIKIYHTSVLIPFVIYFPM